MIKVKKRLIILLAAVAIILGLILVPSLFSDTFTFDIDYYRDGEIYTDSMYSVMSSRDLKAKNGGYSFADVTTGNYKIIVQNNSSPYDPIILDFNNCMGYDLKPVRINMKIVIETYSDSPNVNVNIHDMITGENRNAVLTCNDHNEYVYKWSNA